MPKASRKIISGMPSFQPGMPLRLGLTMAKKIRVMAAA